MIGFEKFRLVSPANLVQERGVVGLRLGHGGHAAGPCRDTRASLEMERTRLPFGMIYGEVCAIRTDEYRHVLAPPTNHLA